jgi:hypothetical protein
MTKKICIVTNLHLSSNPRVWKEANSLADKGYQVVILTVWTSAKKKKEDQLYIRNKAVKYKAPINLIKGEARSFDRFVIRFKSRVAREAKKTLNLEFEEGVGYGIGKMLKAAVAEKADLYIAHTEYGMVVGNKLLKMGYNVAYDIEDWYSRDYLVAERMVDLLTENEKYALNNGKFIACPSYAMGDALQKAYDSPSIEVIYNGFSKKENTNQEIRKKVKADSLVWFSQTIGADRGIETVIQALEIIQDKPLELHLIGAAVAGYEETLKEKFPFHLGHKLFIHPPVVHFDLIGQLAKYEIGLAIENNFPENRNVTVSNKTLQYLQAGLKVLTTATEGQEEVAESFPESMVIVPIGEPKIWAEVIRGLISAPPVSLDKQMDTFNEFYSWEAQEKKLFQLVENATQS